MKRNYQQSCRAVGGVGGGASSSSAGSKGAAGESPPPLPWPKGKLWPEEDQDSGGMDELLAVLGYKVRSSDMAEVAHKLEQLEMVMDTAQQDDMSDLSDTVHYNPSDLSVWVQSMLSELNPSSSSVDLLANQQDSAVFGSNSIISFSNPPPQSGIFSDDSEYDLRAIPGVAAYPRSDLALTETENSRKRIKIGAGSELDSISDSVVSKSTITVPGEATAGGVSGFTGFHGISIWASGIITN